MWRDWALLAVVTVSGVLEGVLHEDLPLPGLSVLLAVGLAPLLLWRRTHPLAAVATAFGVDAVVDIGLIAYDAPALDMTTMVYFLVFPYALFRWGSRREAATGLAIILVAATLEVSAIAVQAQAGRALAATSPSSPLEALKVIELEASRTLAEMRAMVRVLRNETAVDYAPQPGVADLGRLSGASPAGPRVEVTVSGDLAALPAAVDAAASRVAQEAVTNALRHARNATLVDVRVAGDRSTVSLVVRDDGDTGAADPAAEAGFGLTGMVERALLLGGTCRAGPCPSRGWAVSATLPRQVSA